jgi:hypothetical protein
VAGISLIGLGPLQFVARFEVLHLCRSGPMTAIVGFAVVRRIQIKAIKARTIHPFTENLGAADLTFWAVVTTRLREVGALGTEWWWYRFFFDAARDDQKEQCQKSECTTRGCHRRSLHVG